MIGNKEASIMNPDEIYIDQNIGGGRSSLVGRPTERKVMSILEDEDLNAIKHHKSVIERTLKNADTITFGIVEAHYFNDTKIDIIAQELETTPDLCNKLRKRFLEELATEFRLIK